MRRFVLDRTVDVSGVSGIGTVAEGVEFTDGTVVVRWRLVGSAPSVVTPTTVVHADISSVLALHGHNGRTQIVWMDDNNETMTVIRGVIRGGVATLQM